MIKFLLFAYLLSCIRMGAADPQDDVYDVWAGPGLHLMMSDNGTPNNFDDDWVIDWETNREVTVFVFDR